MQDPLILSFSRNLALARLPLRVAISTSGYGRGEGTLFRAGATPSPLAAGVRGALAVSVRSFGCFAPQDDESRGAARFGSLHLVACARPIRRGVPVRGGEGFRDFEIGMALRVFDC
jgi:hypothetical protein